VPNNQEVNVKVLYSFFAAVIVFLVLADGAGAEERSILAFCGSASKPAIEESARVFRERTGIKVELLFGGSGTMLSQMKMSRRGDLYIPGSPDYMLKAEREGLIDSSTKKRVAYLVPAINVQPGNPKNIRTLEDLTSPGVRIGIGNPQAVCVGLYAIEIFEREKLLDKVKKNIVTNATSCAATEALVAMKKLDAVMGWDVFSKWNPGKMETVFLQPGQVPRIAYIPAATSTLSLKKDDAKLFLDFLVSGEGQRIFKKWGYLASEQEARKLAPEATIGGEYLLPAEYGRK
jgi:molybdate transport system substrate-binding protein